MENPFLFLFRARNKPQDTVNAATTFSFGYAGSGKSVKVNQERKRRNAEYSLNGVLHNNYHGDTRTTTTEAWTEEISIMREVVSSLEADGHIVFEYDIPRLGKRIDVLLLLKGIIFCIEFKVGEAQKLESDVDQVLDYALDLKNFHRFSRDKIIVPILVPTECEESTSIVQSSIYDDKVVNPLVTGKNGLFGVIASVLNRFPNETPVDRSWIISPYAPTPTIIEAARSLYENHSVENITRHEADIDLSYKDEFGRTNLERMREGLAALDPSTGEAVRPFHILCCTFKNHRNNAKKAEIVQNGLFERVPFLDIASDWERQRIGELTFFDHRIIL